MVFIVTVQLRDCSVVTGGVVLLFDGTPLRLYVHLGKHRYRGYVIFFFFFDEHEHTQTLACIHVRYLYELSLSIRRNCSYSNRIL